jgi:RNA polymerase sigma factor (TIGR02999 family)
LVCVARTVAQAHLYRARPHLSFRAARLESASEATTVTESGQPVRDEASSKGITELLLECRDGKRDAFDRLFPIVYGELQHIARAHLERERDGHTLSPTALVHEAYMKLVDITRVDWRDRIHFLATASRAMRRVLIDYARKQRRRRRGGGIRPVTLDEALVAADHQADTLLVLDLALEKLATFNQRMVRVVECRFFGGLTEEETAQVLGVTDRTVRRDWIKARAWLQDALDVPAP